MEEKSYQEIAAILSEKDPVMKEIIASVKEDIKPEPGIDVYLDLQLSIASQQLSGKVVKIIWNRFLDLFPERYPEAKLLSVIDHEKLRGVGFSNSKARYIRNVAKFSLENPIDFEHLNAMTDDEIVAYLTQIKGVGKWTVQMILMFSMDRPNVFPLDDFGIQSKMKLWYNLDLEKNDLKKKMVEISKSWEPYKTLASKYLWKS